MRQSRAVIVMILVVLAAVPASARKRRAVRSGTPIPGPVAMADSYSVSRAGTLTVAASSGVLANDSDPQNATLQAVLVTTTSRGALALAPDGSFSYVHDGSSASSDSFTYRATSATAQSAPATVSISIIGTAPAAFNDGYTTPRNTQLVTAAPGVLANDTLNGAAIASYGKTTGTEQTSVGQATATSQGGSVSLSANGGFTYAPPGGFSGNDTFRYRLSNPTGVSTAEVTVMVIAPPDAVNDSYNTANSTALTTTSTNGVLANDTLGGGAIASYGASTGNEQTSIGSNTPTTAGGTVRVNANGSFTYTPPGSFSGNDTFKYKLVNGGGSDVATVTVAVAAAQDYDYEVTSPGSFFSFNGEGQNPAIVLERGRTYRFKINTSSNHPFEIKDAPPGSVTNNRISKGTLTFVVPNSSAEYDYWCWIHEFGGIFQVP